ncbi:regulatory protein SipA [Merismopedia glauca]|uniref:DUF3148 domain-containing protein n=1 Tax=Merismopedia glauca CCAP 1448/3 TaxID=1296344 RepID=A0A2T1BXR9_9CYAN|nr:DUF3148 domain-containing protein [Merismopedia glauca]PSB00791.1 DUF3148 domain-containing protein [Merismopedia glauca CCAP 1448/3]
MSKEFTVGETVRLVSLPPYLKTADPMPMLRPPDIINLGEEGIILDRRPGGYWSVKFARGAFLIDSQYLEAVNPKIPDPLVEE